MSNRRDSHINSMQDAVLITGGAGFIGSALVRHLIENTSESVLNVDALTYAGNRESLRSVGESPRYMFEKQDIRDREALTDLFEEHRPRAVMHLAAESHVDRSIESPAAFVRTNVNGTVRLLEAVRGYLQDVSEADRDRFRFLHVSTDEVYGSLGEGGAFSEASRYAPNSPYAASKAAADHFVRAWGETYGLPVIVTNCSNNYGPYQFPEKLIPHMILSALEGRDLPVYGDGSNVRDWLYVDDHVRALWRVVQEGELGETYLIGGRCERQNIEVVRTICTLLDRMRPRKDGLTYRRQITLVEDRPGHDQRYAIDPSKIEDEIGWRPRETFETGLKKTVEWYLGNPWWWEPIRSEEYDGERLGTVQ